VVPARSAAEVQDSPLELIAVSRVNEALEKTLGLSGSGGRSAGPGAPAERSAPRRGLGDRRSAGAAGAGGGRHGSPGRGRSS